MKFVFFSFSSKIYSAHMGCRFYQRCNMTVPHYSMLHLCFLARIKVDILHVSVSVNKHTDYREISQDIANDVTFSTQQWRVEITDSPTHIVRLRAKPPSVHMCVCFCGRSLAVQCFRPIGQTRHMFGANDVGDITVSELSCIATAPWSFGIFKLRHET